ncbi:MAG: excinuclease ABC subunit UvrC [Deltaproteobacteria bacterium]|nr:excinuclease ABC subunit UvrC [Deltaproteobacteria bacterium]
MSILPESPGVYIFKDEKGRVLYIGKARNIKERVKSYFRADLKDTKTLNLVRKIKEVEPIVTTNEKEAFLLENNLIKEHAPPYNINLKDDKTYISIKISVNEEYPGLYITRKVRDDGALYFGPYPHAKDVRDILRTIQSVYPIRRCKNTVFKKRSRPCILAQIGKCLGPCSLPVKKEEYMETVRGIIDFFSGKEDTLLKELEQKIKNLAKEWRFEEAQKLKEKYMAIRNMVEKQNVHKHFGKNRDVWAFSYVEGSLFAVILNFRQGVLVGKKHFKKNFFVEFNQDEIVSLLFQYYSSRPIPEEIFLSEDIENSHLLEDYLCQKAKRKVYVLGPTAASEARDLIWLALENLHATEEVPLGLAFLEHLHLSRVPKRIEVYDCSHLFGTSPSASMVVFEDFTMKKDDYRVFHIRGPNPLDDLASLREVLTRRLRDEKLGPLPDLIIVDGGRSHLASVQKVFTEFGVTIDLVGVTKGRRRRKMEELIYLPGRRNPLYLPRASRVYREILRMRDEAHRFALFSHRRRKKKDAYGG